jgi:hypothetical protein
MDGIYALSGERDDWKSGEDPPDIISMMRGRR